jgi:hypothetical protein
VYENLLATRHRRLPSLLLLLFHLAAPLNNPPTRQNDRSEREQKEKRGAEDSQLDRVLSNCRKDFGRERSEDLRFLARGKGDEDFTYA